MPQTLQYDCPECPTDCDSAVLPDINIAECVEALDVFESEISDIYIALPDPANRGEPLGGPADWTSASAWDTVIDDTVIHLSGIGDLAEPDRPEITLQKRWVKHGQGLYLLNFDILDVNDTVYEAMRQWQCGGASLHIWFGTIGGHLFGGERGIITRLLPPSLPKERGTDTYEKAMMVFRWYSQCDPERILNPLADTGMNGGGGT